MKENISEPRYKIISLDEYKLLLPKLHRCVLYIALEIKRMCDKHHIKYFLIGGSLLGAVRHKGFIPWDDDMDIGLLRNDYDRFISACESELGSEFRLITANIASFGLPYSKIQLNNTFFLEKGAPEQTDFISGVFVDIFPIDCLPDSSFQKKCHSLKLKILRYSLLKKCNYKINNRGISIKRILLNSYSVLHSKKYLVNKLTKVSKKYNRRKTKYYYNTGSAYEYGREIFPSESLDGELPEIEFEGNLFKCPKNKEEILQLLYGDYMKLPPEDKRFNRHGVLSIDLGKYETL